MIAEPPTVDCPGCGHDVEVAHLPVRRFDGGVFYLRTETDVDALLRHWDRCPNVEPTGAGRSAVTCPGCGDDVAVEYLRDRGVCGARVYLMLRPDDSALLEHWSECPNDAAAP